MYSPHQQRPTVWTSNPAEPYLPGGERASNLAIAVGLGIGGGVAAASAGIGGGYSLFDSLQANARLAGNLSPFSIANTFRAAEWMSPFTSAPAQGMRLARSVTGSGAEVYQRSWDKTFLQGKGGLSLDYLERITGQDLSKLGLAGKGSFPVAGGPDSLVFERAQGSTSGRGSLYLKTGSKSHLLSDSISLFERTLGDEHLFTRNKGMNTAAYGVLQQLGMTEIDGFRPDQFFAQETMGAGGRYNPATHFPVPSISGPAGTIADIGRRSTLPLAPFASGMERLNRLLQGTMEQIPFVRDVDSALQKKMGFSMKIRSGPAHSMFMRFGVKAGAVGALGVGLSQTDWARRQGGLPGHLAMSGLTSLGVSGVVSRFAKGPQAAMMAGLASFAGQMILPGFDEGVIPGIATTAVNLDVASSGIGAITGTSAYRRVVEGLFPGISDWKTGALTGIGVAVLSHGSLPGKIAKSKYGWNGMLPSSLRNRIGINMSEVAGQVPPTRSIRSHFYRSVETMAQTQLGFDYYENIARSRGPEFIKHRRYLAGLQWAAASDGLDSQRQLANKLSQLWELAEETKLQEVRKTGVNQSLITRLEAINRRYPSGAGFGAGAMRTLEATGAKAYHAFFGASLDEKAYKEAISGMGFNTRLGRLGMLFGTGFAAHAVLTKGVFGSLQGPGEKINIYSGRQQVAVGKSRWWEGGGTPFEGLGVDYHRPSEYTLMMNRSKQKAVWGEDEDKISPMRKFWIKNFTYDLERQQYYDRPYPISMAAFENVPVIGGLLSSTVGRLIKPSRLMHVSDWVREGPDGELQFASRPMPGEPSYNLGGLGPGTPTTSGAPGFLAGSLNYQFRELEGMTGWFKNVMTAAITGSATFGAQTPVLASAAQMTSPVESYWDMALGGLFGTTEALRRFVPRRRSEIEQRNPILNAMPSWIPSRFHYGDPYRSVEHGDVRLPGAGYQSLHPELAGLRPEAYPLIHRYAILADIAPTSSEFFKTREGLYQNRAAGKTSAEVNRYMDGVDRMLNEKQIQMNWQQADSAAIITPLSRITQPLWFDAQETLRGITAPVEYMTLMGFRPVQKFLSNRSAIEQYEYERLYGTPLAFWDEPIRDWFRPAAHSAANFLGWDGKPAWRKDSDDVGEYFDKLQFAKTMAAANQAGAMGDKAGKRALLRQASETRYGVNPQGNPLGIYKALPDSEKKFFDSFAYAAGSDRKRILEMVPGDQAALYESVWNRLDAGDPTMSPYAQRQLDEQFLSQKYAELMMDPMPHDDWIGWHQDVSLDDVKMKYISTLGKDIHEYDMWESQERQMVRKPYLEGSDEFLMQSPFSPGRTYIEGAIYRLANPGGNGTGPQMTVHSTNSWLGSRGQFEWNDNRETDIFSGIANALR